MLCSYKYCMSTDKLASMNCHQCQLAKYCSTRCKDLDWTMIHKYSCKGNISKPISANDTQSTLKSIGKQIEDYEIVIKDGKAELGKGSYGSVKLVKDKLNGQQYAMKILNKKQILEYCSTENLKREIKIQRRLNHPHITRLYHYFEDKQNVYLILELAENGSLFTYIRKRRRLPENEAFIYFFQTCLGIEYLHKKNIIHRDLKPENLLLDKQGNVKVCDFGWSAEFNVTNKRNTFCGTLDYMAPEMLMNKPYDFSLDIWCLGILLYELIYGYAPFKGQTQTEKCNNIVNLKSIEYDSSISFDARNLITNILKINPLERITLQEIFDHQFMKKHYRTYGIDLNHYLYKEDKSHNDTRSLSPAQEEIQSRRFNLPQHRSQNQLIIPKNVSITTMEDLQPKQQEQSQQQYVAFQSYQKSQSLSYQIPSNGNSTATSNYLQDDDVKTRVSRISQRQQINQQQREIGSLRQTQTQELGFMDRVFQALGCLNRDKQTHYQQQIL